VSAYAGAAEVGAVLKVARMVAGLNVDELAKLVDTPVPYLALLEAGEVRPSDAWVRKVMVKIGRTILA